jgi:O-methyltransferase
MPHRKLLRLYRALRNLPQDRSQTLQDRFALLRRGARHILPEYRFKWPQMDWWNDAEFTAYLARFGELEGNDTDRRYTVAQLLRLVSAVEGDTAEVGAFKGAMSWLICKAGGHARVHHIFDSFEGLSEPSAIDGEHWSKGDLSCGEDAVHRNLAQFAGQFRTYKGWVPKRFPEVEAARFAFVHIDVDLYQPTRDSIEFFHPRLNVGGILICDDYGFSTCPGATKACNDFLASKPEKMIGLSGGGGFLIKGAQTAPSF